MSTERSIIPARSAPKCAAVHSITPLTGWAVTKLPRSDVTVIRPMIYMPEKDIRYFAKKAELPVVESTCPANGNTEREEMKKFLARLDRENRGLKYRIYGAIQRGGVDGFREFGRMAGVTAYSDEDEE